MAYDGELIFGTKVDGSGVESGISSLEGKFSALGGMLATAAKAATAAFTAAGVAAVKVGADFEAQMSRVKAISGATTQEFEQLWELAKQLGADTAFSASEAAAGMENLASAGFSANEIMGAMPGLLDLAAVSGGDVAAASEIAASALNAFGLEASEAGHVADVFARAAADTNAETADMGDAMKYVAPVAKAMGISLEEAAAAIGIMSDAGVKGSQAGTSLRGALSRLAKPTEQMMLTMQSLGVSFYDSEGNMISLKDQISVLKGSFEGLTQEQRNQALVTLYGQESLSGMLALIEAGPDQFDALTQSLINSDGAAAEMAATMQDNLKGALEGIGGQLETFGIEIYEQLQEPLKNASFEIAESIDRIYQAFKTGGINEAAKEAGVEIGNFINTAIENAPQAIESAGEFLKNFIDGFNTSLREMDPQNISDSIVALLNGAASLIEGLTETAIILLMKLAEALVIMVSDPEFLASLSGIGISILKGIVNGIREENPELAAALDQIIFFLEDLSTNIAGIQAGIIETISGGAGEILGKFEFLTTGVTSAIDFLLVTIPQKWEEIKNAVISIAKNMIEGVTTKIEDIKAAFTSLENIDLSEIGKNIIDGLINGVASMIGKVREKVSEIGNAIKDTLTGTGDGGMDIHSPSRVMKNDVGRWIPAGLAEGIDDGEGKLMDKVKSMGKGIKEHLQNVTASASLDTSYNLALNSKANLDKFIGGSGATTTSNAIDNSGDVNVTVNVYPQNMDENSGDRLGNDVGSKAADIIRRKRMVTSI